MTKGELAELDPGDVKSLLDAGEILLIDVREPDEYAREHIKGALLVPLASMSPDALKERHERIVFHCRSGGRSRQAAERMLAAGKSEVSHLKGGIAAWIAGGLPIERDERAPLPIMRQVQIVAGGLGLLGTILGVTLHGGFLIVPAFVGAGLTLAGITGNCPMANILSLMPWNNRSTGNSSKATQSCCQ